MSAAGERREGESLQGSLAHLTGRSYHAAMSSTVPEAIERLIVTFHDNADHYRSPVCNETLCRIDFINPMFKSLGWDMDNAKGYADAYRDVIHEDAIKVGGATKAPDYCFRIGGTRRLAFVDQMLTLHNQVAAAKPGHAKDALQRQIDATDVQIDRLVYELYGLTEEEIRIVEDAGHA
jgi:hypothetical protein